jgi:hypothetical protein
LLLAFWKRTGLEGVDRYGAHVVSAAPPAIGKL